MIELTDISKKTDGRRILSGVSLTVAAGSLTALLGPSGAGKSTLLRIIAGFEKPEAGRVSIDGQTVYSDSDHRIRMPEPGKLSFIFQSLALWPHMRVVDHLRFVLDRRRFPAKAQREEKIHRTLALLHLDLLADRLPEALSGGEQQRLAVARALVTDPDYLLMDEPFSNLDDVLKHELLALIPAMKHQHNITVVYVTHNIDEALYLADNIAIVKDGRLVDRMRNDQNAADLRGRIAEALKPEDRPVAGRLHSV